MIDVIVVGSGASGVHAAQELLNQGCRVHMLDVGLREDRYQEPGPAEDFLGLRQIDSQQHRLFLGEEFEGVPMGPVRVGAQLTPPRQYIARIPDPSLRIDSNDFWAMQSFALGGLASGWGAAVPPFSDADLIGWPINRGDLQEHYDAITDRIGVCGTDGDDLARFFGPSPGLLPPARVDSNGSFLLSAYRRRAQLLNERGLYMGLPRLAMTTRRHAERGPMKYLDMEFWNDTDSSVYRPVYTLEQLRRDPRFSYTLGVIVDRYAEDADGIVTVQGRSLATQERLSFNAARLVLAAGTLQTARIVLRSVGAGGEQLPLLSNPYTYFPCLIWTRLGAQTRDRRHSLTQLMGYFDPHRRPNHSIQVQFYSYRSLLTFKLIKEAPLPAALSLKLMQLLQSYFVIIGVHHPDFPTSHKWVGIDPEADTLRISYHPSISERRRRTKIENELMLQTWRLGCQPLGRIDPGNGASIHYAGTLPMREDGGPLTTTPTGRLRAGRSVYIADGACFPTLPAKGLTFTLMANANRVARHAAQR